MKSTALLAEVMLLAPRGLLIWSASTARPRTPRRAALLSHTADQTLAHRCVRVCSLRCKIGEQGRWIVFAAHGARACAWNESPAPGLNYRTLATRVAAAAAAEPNCVVALFAGITLKTLGQSGLRFIVSLFACSNTKHIAAWMNDFNPLLTDAFGVERGAENRSLI